MCACAQIRFGIASAVFTFLGAATSGVIGALAARSLPDSDNTTVKDCVRYALTQIGNPLSTLFQTAAAIISLLIVWPFHGSGREPMLWEHLQRFVWTDDQIEAAMESRDEASHTLDMSKVRPSHRLCAQCGVGLNVCTNAKGFFFFFFFRGFFLSGCGARMDNFFVPASASIHCRFTMLLESNFTFLPTSDNAKECVLQPILIFLIMCAGADVQHGARSQAAALVVPDLPVQRS